MNSRELSELLVLVLIFLQMKTSCDLLNINNSVILFKTNVKMMSERRLIRFITNLHDFLVYRLKAVLLFVSAQNINT